MTAKESTVKLYETIEYNFHVITSFKIDSSISISCRQNVLQFFRWTSVSMVTFAHEHKDSRDSS